MEEGLSQTARAHQDQDREIRQLETRLRNLEFAEDERKRAREVAGPTDIVGTNMPDRDECACRRCSRFVTGGTPIHANEINWTDDVRCTTCGRALLEGPAPLEFAETWEKRRLRRAATALARLKEKTGRTGDH